MWFYARRRPENSEALFPVSDIEINLLLTFRANRFARFGVKLGVATYPSALMLP